MLACAARTGSVRSLSAPARRPPVRTMPTLTKRAAAVEPSAATSFTIPLHFAALASPDAGAQYIDLESLATTSSAALLTLADDPADPDAFTATYALLARYPRLAPREREAAVEAARNAAARAGAAPPACKRAAFLLAGAAAAAEGEADAKKRRAWDKAGREAVLETARALLDAADAHASAWAPADRGQFAGVLLRMVLALVESAPAAKDRAARPALARVLAGVLAADPAQVLPATAGIIHLLNRFEHVAVPIADMVQRVVSECPAREKFAADLVQEIARLDAGHLARDTASAKACAACIGELAERLPKVVLNSIAQLLGLLDGESYTMRNGILHAIGRLICAYREDPAQAATRDSLFDILLERALRDVNAFTRSKALQTWVYLAEERAIPYRMFYVVAEVASSRLDDRTAAVRRSAAHLLCQMLKSNPYGPALRLSQFRAKLQECGGEPEELEAAAEGKADGSDADDSEALGNGGAGDAEGVDKEIDGDGDNANEHSQADADAPPEEATGEEEVVQESELGVAEEAEQSEEVVKQLYYKSAFDFITVLEAGLLKAYKMLRSTSISDVSEAVALLVTAVQFQLEAAASGRATRAMLALVLAREVNIQTAAIDAYQRLLAPHRVSDGQESIGAVDEKDAALLVANGLIALVTGATIGEVACLEVLIEKLMKVEHSIVSPAVIAIMWDMFAGKIPGATHVQRSAACVYIGMFAAERPDSLQGRLSVIQKVGLNCEDTSYFHWTCIALGKLPAGSDEDGSICRQLISLVEDGGCGLAAAEQAVNAIYRLHPSPEEDVSALVARMFKSLCRSDGGPSAVSIYDLTRFLQLVGHVAIKQLVRVETLVSQVRKAAGREDEEEAGAEAEKALEFAETELTHPKSLLGQFGNMTRSITADDNAPPELRASAVLCLTKLMCVKASFCEANLQLLFTVLERASAPSVRANAITALGDLAFRFPNLVEPWSGRIYAALEDEHVRVRKNALMALSHLILNDMVKVKGQMVGLALRVLDKEERIAELARVFFHELSRKNQNAIYNLLPDTISCLSRRKDLSSGDLKKVMSFLLGFINKGRQAEGVVDRLCQRFRTAENEQESRDIAFCIAQLNMNDRCIGKLADAFKHYAAALSDDEVHQHLAAAVGKARKAMASGNGGSSGKDAASVAEGGEVVDGRGRADELLEKMERQRAKGCGNGSGDDD